MDKRMRYSKEEEKIIIERYLAGETSTKIAKSMGLIGHASVTKILKRNNIEVRKNYDKMYLIKCNRSYFKEIDTEDKAYWLGFIAADGHVDDNLRVRISLAYSDANHLVKFVKCLNSDHKVIKQKRNDFLNGRYQITYRATLEITSQEMANDLCKWGMGGIKTDNLKFPTFLREDLIRHYLRGYVDGDGCWTRQKFTFVSTISFLKDSLAYFNRELGLSMDRKFQIESKDGNVASIIYGGRLQVKKIYGHLYKDAHIFMERKKLAAEKIINVIDGRRVLTSEQRNESLHQTNLLV